MKLKFFAIPALSPEDAEAEVNRFLGAHRISHVERQFIADGAASFWSVCVSWVEGDAASAQDAARRGRVDYRARRESPPVARLSLRLTGTPFARVAQPSLRALRR